jgi:anti-sigma B factor antagonist
MEPRQPDSPLNVERRPDAIVARFSREVILSGPEADAIDERLTALLGEVGQRPLLVDFGNVRSLTSFMLGNLVGLNRAADSAGVRLALFNLRPDVREIFEVTRLHLILRLYGSESEALQGP